MRAPPAVGYRDARMSVVIWSFIIVMILMTLAGASSIIRKTKTPEDYLVAGRDVAPWLSALSTVGTNNSGFMFIGMIAYTYRIGIESIWMMVGWIIGDLAAWFHIHPRVREASGNVRVNTLTALIGTRKERTDRWVIIAGGVVTILFLGVYAAGQLKAGSTALHALFGWDMRVGALIGTVIVIIYSYAGGIRADIWTDAAQSFVMIFAMISIVIAGWSHVGGPTALFANLEGQEPQLVELFPRDLEFGIPLFLIGFLFAGFGVIGQPHLMTRLMAIESPQATRRARLYYFSWFIPFFLAAVAVGLYTRATIPAISGMEVAQGLDEPTELALPLATMRLLPDIFTGVALAGLFAATVSTADSQIIVCSGSLTQDIHRKWKDSYLASKVGTFSVTAMALVIALWAPEGVFTLVLIAWSAMGASLGPLLVIRLFHWPLTPPVGLTMVIASIATVVGWQYAGLSDDVFKMFPGMLAGALVYAAWWPFRRRA